MLENSDSAVNRQVAYLIVRQDMGQLRDLLVKSGGAKVVGKELPKKTRLAIPLPAKNEP